jgi:hypothetical protein
VGKWTGSTRAWRELRLAVLERDRWTCQLLAEDGHVCGRKLRPREQEPDPRHQASVEHLDKRVEGGQLRPSMDRLVAACVTHNSQGGAAVTNGRRRETERSWSW